MFYGEYYHIIDNKGRFTIPNKFRNLLVDNFFITRELDGALTIYDTNKWNQLEKKLNELPITNENARVLRRFYLGGCVDVQPDKQGRVLIPIPLRSHANLDNEIVVIGVGDHIELWNKKIWDDKYKFDNYDKLAENIENLGI